MGKKRNQEEIEAMTSFLKDINLDLIFDSNLHLFKSRSDQIWTTLSIALKNVSVKISPLGLYTAIIKNYYNIWQALDMPRVSIDHTDTDENNPIFKQEENQYSSTSSSLYSEQEDATVEFSIVFTPNEYNDFQEEVKNYRRRDLSTKRSGHKTVLRKYYTWENYTWPQLLRNKIFQHTTLNCSIVFKRAKLHLEGPIFATISGKCKECEAKLQGEILTNPKDEANVIFAFKMSGKHNTKHLNTNKIALKGKERQNIILQMVKENKSASTIRNNLANTIMKYGDTEPAFIPKLGTLRTAKSAFLKSSQIDSDPIVALYKAKSFQEYGNTIHNVGYSPFFVYFWTKAQIMMYRKFCENNQKRISIDSTGGVAKKINYPDQLNSKSIFLYEIVINFHGQYSVGSMLTDNHSALAIQNWLNVWFRAAGASPSEVVVDMSLALMYACVTVFTRFKSLADYLDNCYKILFEDSQSMPDIFIRNDVAHIIKLMSSWDCLKKAHRLTKQFYMRALGQLIQCNDINDMKNLLEALFIVAHSDTEGVNDAGIATSCERKKKWLVKRIATGTVESSVSDQWLNLDQFESTVERDKEESNLKNNFTSWVSDIASTAQHIANQPGEIGDRGNQQVLPEFVSEVLKISATLPMWTALMCQYYPFSKRIGSSASSESNFNQLKNRLFSDKQLPLRADDFVLEYVKRANGHLTLVSSRAQKQVIFHNSFYNLFQLIP